MSFKFVVFNTNFQPNNINEQNRYIERLNTD